MSETFKTFQGEGPSAGQLALFIRLGACNLHCKWCDTPYTWAFSERLASLHEGKKKYLASAELKRVSLISVASQILDAKVPLCVVTGGEPLLQLKPLAELMSSVNEATDAPRFEIETAGTIAPGELLGFTNTYYNVSPKLAHSGNGYNERYHPEVLKDFAETGRARFKFVIDHRKAFWDDGDMLEVIKIVNECKLNPHDVWLMPCGTKSYEIDKGLRLLAPLAIDFGFNLTGRMHITIWGDERGH